MKSFQESGDNDFLASPEMDVAKKTKDHPSINDYYRALAEGDKPIKYQHGLSNYSNVQFGDDRVIFNKSMLPAVLEHTGSEAFDAHLQGVQAILRHWGAPAHLYNAGLFHSIYGTEGFQGFSIPLSDRDAIRNLIGDEAEKLCWIFCMVDRSTVDETVFNWNPRDVNEAEESTTSHYTFLARPELGRFEIHVNKHEWIDFIELTLSDWLEQVQGAAETASDRFCWKAGEAYAYRRTAYAKMAEILSHERPDRLSSVVKETVAHVYGTEHSSTRHLVQLRTPPMSDSAKEALAALRSAGEEGIPVDYAPQSVRDEL